MKGLPSNEVYYVFEDSKKYIWICTDAGIVKYNANTFAAFNSANGLPDNTIFEVKEDKTGRIWFRSFSGKMGYIQNDSVVCPGANSRILSFISDGIVCSFTFDKDNNLYVGKRNTGTISFLKIKPPYGASDVSEIWREPKTNRGITIIKIDSGLVFSDVRGIPNVPYLLRVKNEDNTLIYSEDMDVTSNTLYTSAIRLAGKIFLGANHVLREIDEQSGKCATTLYTSPIVALSSIDSKVVVGQQLNSLDIYPHTSGKDIPPLPEKPSVSCAVKDYQNGIWISTLEKGVFYLSPDPVTQLSTSNREGELITCITPVTGQPEKFIVGYNSGRISLLSFDPLNSESEDLVPAGQKFPGPVITIYNKHVNSVIASGSSGTVELSLKNNSHKKFVPSLVIAESPKKITGYRDNLLLLFIKHLKIFRVGEKKLETILTSGHRLNCVTYDSLNDKIYIGSLQGFYEYNNSPTLDECVKILGCRIQDVAVKNDIVYAASKNEGLIIIKGKKIDTISMSKGLLSNICNAVNIRNNEVWVSTNKGLSKIEQKTGGYRVTNFPISGFFTAPSVSKVEFTTDRVLFFSEDRIYSFNDKTTNSAGLVRISSMTANNKPVPVSRPIKFKYNQQDIVVNFEALFYDHRGLIHYRYKLGHDDEWHYTTQPLAFFPSPSYGTYNFILQACDRSGAWIHATNSLRFTVEKPIWMNIWFIVFVVALFSVTAAALIRYRFSAALKKEQEKNIQRIAMQDLESRVAQAQMNPHFIFNALNSIQQFILGNDNESAYRYLSKFAKLVRKLLETNTTESILLDDEIDLIKRYIEIESLRFEDSFLYEFDVDEELLKKGIHIPHMLIQPFVENAIWHGLRRKKENKKLTISFHQHANDLILCIVEDNGVGREQAYDKDESQYDKKSLALDLIKQRMDLLRRTKNKNCGFQISDKKDKYDNPQGTYVRIIIPVLKYEYAQSYNN